MLQNVPRLNGNNQLFDFTSSHIAAVSQCIAKKAFPKEKELR